MSKIKVLIDMRPALDGYFGIPLQVRLLFAGLASCPDFRISGFLQMSGRPIIGGLSRGELLSHAERHQRYAKAIMSLKGKSAPGWKTVAADWLSSRLDWLAMVWSALTGFGSIHLQEFDASSFYDFVWQHFFARGVPPAAREAVLRCDYQVCSVPWRWMHAVGIDFAGLFGKPRYPCIDTRGVDVFIAETPYPGRIHKHTALVVHYHDAIPVFMLHTISDRAFHHASHLNALKANVRDGAWFVCVSEATRRDLLNLFPEVEPRSVTIHNMVSPAYRPNPPEPNRIAGIVQRYSYDEFRPKSDSSRTSRSVYKLARSFSSEADKSAFYMQSFCKGVRFLLMVSTIEPRKNHLRLIEAWEMLRDRFDPGLKLILVGQIGWEYEEILEACRAGIERGGLVILHSVPASALGVLYQQAAVTVCPSVGEGFDLSGVEAMRCGGVVAASDIPVHREVYGDAAIYFDPYDTKSLVLTLQALIYDKDASVQTEALRAAALEQSARYLPEHIVPQWEAFLKRVVRERSFV